MSLAVSCAGCGLEFSSRRPLRAGRLLRRSCASSAAPRPSSPATSTPARRWRGSSPRSGTRSGFAHHYLVPLCSAIWSAPPETALDFPARYAVSFLANHGVLGLRHFRWRTVTGGSREYVRALLGRFGGKLHLDGVRVDRARRRRRHAADRTTASRAGSTGSSSPRTPTRRWRCWPRRPPTSDACWARSRSPSTRRCCTPTQRFLPRSRGVRAAWNYQLATCAPQGTHPTMTYSMNRLQRLAEDEEYCVTLNRGREIDEARRHRPLRLHPPAVHVHEPRGPVGARLAERAEPHRVRRRVAGLRVPRGRARLRAARRGGDRPMTPHVPLHGHRDARPADAGRARLPLPRRLLRARRRPARRAEPPARWSGTAAARPVTIRDADYLAGDRPLADAIRTYVRSRGHEPPAGPIRLVTSLRLAGYVFNPVSFWYLAGADGAHGDASSPRSTTRSASGARTCSSRRTRSPALGCAATCTRRNSTCRRSSGWTRRTASSCRSPASASTRASTSSRTAAARSSPTLTGRGQPLTDLALLRTLARNPLLSGRVTGLIHWQALRLWLKGVPVFRKPPFAPGQGSAR